MLNFGAFIAFMGVNAATFVRYFLRCGAENHLAGAMATAWIWNLWLHFPTAQYAGEKTWCRLGGRRLIYGVWKTSGFRKTMSFEAPPE